MTLTPEQKQSLAAVFTTPALIARRGKDGDLIVTTARFGSQCPYGDVIEPEHLLVALGDGDGSLHWAHVACHARALVERHTKD